SRLRAFSAVTGGCKMVGRSLLVAALAALALPVFAAAQETGSVTQGLGASRDVTLYVGTDPGGGYGLNARVLPRHLGPHLPRTPSVIVQNMPGAGGLKVANYVFKAAPRDGSAFGITGPTVLLDPLLDGKGSQFDTRQFTWIGSTANEVSTCIAWHDAPVQSI